MTSIAGFVRRGASRPVSRRRQSQSGRHRRCWRAVRQADELQHGGDIAARLGDQRQFLQLGCQLLPHLEQSAHPCARQLADTSQVNTERQGAAAADGEKLSGELLGREDVDRSADDNEGGIVS